MTQGQRVIDYLKNHRYITVKKAVNDLGINSLTKVISDLYRQGYPLNTTIRKGKNRYGEKTKWAEYSLED